MSFEQLGLSSELLKAVSDSGYKDPTPIQSKAIPLILQGKDIMGAAQTGTGKTAGFTLPMLRRLEAYANSSMSPARHPVRALILVPTRELAIQVFENVKNYSKYTALKSTLVYGGVNIDSQISAIRSGVEILVATPGRLLDHIQQKHLMLSNVEIFVLDEADRMLDMGFLPDIKRILNLLPEKRQNLMFSATFSEPIKALAKQFLHEPVLVEVAKQNSVNDLIKHVVYTVDAKSKTSALVRLIKQQKFNQALIFVKTKSGSDRLARQLVKDGLMASAIHGDKNQQQRCLALDEFKQGAIQALVATDVAARGLDIADLPCVINYELPTNPEDYIHRIGRTGRAGVKGFAISLVSESEQKFLKDIEKLIQQKIAIRNDYEKNTVQLHVAKPRFDKPVVNNTKNKSAVKPKTATENNFSAEVIFFNGEYSNRKKPQSVSEQDPLFTQPYVAEKSEITLAAEAKSGRKIPGFRMRKHPVRPVPALFSPPINNKNRVNKSQSRAK